MSNINVTQEIPTYTEEELETYRKEIAQMDHKELCKQYRYAPAGHPFFNTKFDLFEKFMDRFNSFGGMTTEMSKLIDEEHNAN